MKDEESILVKGLKKLNIAYQQAQIDTLLAYINLLDEWNQKINLTAVRDRQSMIRRHLLDSLSILPYLKGREIIDIGSGAGLPGIPLSIMAPLCQFQLIDSHPKKQVFLQYTVNSLQLNNVKCVKTLVENYHPQHVIHTLITRAFAPLPRLLKLIEHLFAPDTQLLAMMGKEDLTDLPTGFELKEVVQLKVPDEPATRQLAIICKKY